MSLATKTEVIKASPAIQIQGKTTSLQRRAWSVLLANAYDELPTHDIHSVRIVELAEKLDFNSGNKDYLKETLEALVDCKVKWNILEKDKTNTWGVASLLASTEMTDGVCTYAFAPHLRPKLHNPRIYAKINLRLQNEFKSKYALILWELCVDYFDEARGEGETPWITLEEFKELMGFDESEYLQFKILNRDVIKPAIKEVNGITDFFIEVEQRKRGRKVAELKFRVRKIKKISKPQQTQKQGTLFPEHDDLEGVGHTLYAVGVTRAEALRIFNQEWGYVKGERPTDMDFAEYIDEKIHLMKNRSGLNNETGFLLKAIRDNYPNPSYRQEKRERARKDMKQQKAAIEKEWSAKRSQRVREIANDNPNLLDEIEGIIKKVTNERIQKHSIARDRLQRYPSINEAYERDMVVQTSVNGIIKETFPDRFTDIDAEYEERIANFEKEIENLG